MGKHSSGHNENSKLQHAVHHNDPDNLGGVVGIDVALKEGAEEWLEYLVGEEADMNMDEWMKFFHAKGDKNVLKDVRTDLHIRVVEPGEFYKGEGVDQDFIREELVTKLVDLMTDEKDPLCGLYFENGEACSTGGFSRRAQSLLSQNISFFDTFYQAINDNFVIKQTWCRASAKGTHKKHNDSFCRGATHRIILSINCYGKEMIFSK